MYFFSIREIKIPTCLISTYTHNTLYFRPVQLIPQVLKTKNNPDALKQILSNQFFFKKSHIDHSIVIGTTLISCSMLIISTETWCSSSFLKGCQIIHSIYWLTAESHWDPRLKWSTDRDQSVNYLLPVHTITKETEGFKMFYSNFKG